MLLLLNLICKEEREKARGKGNVFIKEVDFHTRIARKYEVKNVIYLFTCVNNVKRNAFIN